MKLNKITIGQLCNNRLSAVLDYKGKMMISDHIGQEYLFEEPCRIDAITILVVVRGRLEYTVNLEQNIVDKPSILVNMPENIIQFLGSENLDAYAILISSELLDSMPYDMIQKAKSYLPVKQHFHASVPIEQLSLLIPFYELIRSSLSKITPETDEIVKSLLQAFLLSVLGLMRDSKVEELEVDHTVSRGTQLLFEKFMDILAKYHQHERMVQFYADKLFVTPKYLSMVVKEYSGKSPSDWISEYVIAEAKSLLHYSGYSAQEVAFHLNFPSQSAFCKFFKQKTGQSPRQYMRGDRNK